MNPVPPFLLRALRPLGLAALLCAGGGAALAQAEAPTEGITWSASAFGTIGWAQSNRPWRYQHTIDDNGTAERDTVFGAQVDAQLAPAWSATLQARLAPSIFADDRWDLRAAWAFVAWRPNNDWLLRVGKLRVPFLLRSELLDVGQTYDEARLPNEIYTLAPSNDFTGAHVSRSWTLAGGDLNLDFYRGSARLAKRTWLSAGVPPMQPAGAKFIEVDTTVQGLVGTWRTPETMARLGLHHAVSRRADGQAMTVKPTLAPLGPGLAYWQTDNQLPGPGVEGVPRIRNFLLTAGVETRLGQNWRVAAELARVWQRDIETGIDAVGGYATVYRSWGAFTPYASVAALRTSSTAVEWTRQLETTRLPAMVPGADLLNASMRASAEGVPAFRQHSLALGSSWALDARSKLKLEWMRTFARQSQFFDLPAGEPLQVPRRVDVFSANYSFVF